MAGKKAGSSERDRGLKGAATHEFMVPAELGPVYSWSFNAVEVDGQEELRFNSMRRVNPGNLSTALVATLNAVAAMKKRDQKKIMKMFEDAASGERFIAAEKDGEYFIGKANKELVAHMQKVESELEDMTIT
jgi:hypothetical protein